jgi:hypothetical protein
MGFYQAGKPTMPSYVNAEAQQAAIAAQLREAKQREKAGYFGGGLDLAQYAPEGAWGDLGASMGVPGMEATGAAGTQAAAEAGIMEGLASEAAALDALSAGATGAEAAAATAAAEGAVAGTGAGATPGIMSALGAMGPMGWAALAAIGLGLAS